MPEELTFTLSAFEGPLDLLLHLLSKNKVSIIDIPIAQITDQYFDYINAAEALDMDISGEFLVMAAQLLLIKSRMLLPVHETEEDDPRAELIDRLQEYKRYKAVAEEMDKQQHARDDVCFKAEEVLDIPRVKLENRQIPVQRLYEAFFAVMDRNLTRVPLEAKNFRGVIGRDPVSIRECSVRVVTILKKKKKVAFDALFEEAHTRGAMVATFLAVLELIKEHLMNVLEEGNTIYCIRGEADGEVAVTEEY